MMHYDLPRFVATPIHQVITLEPGCTQLCNDSWKN